MDKVTSDKNKTKIYRNIMILLIDMIKLLNKLHNCVLKPKNHNYDSKNTTLVE